MQANEFHSNRNSQATQLPGSSVEMRQQLFTAEIRSMTKSTIFLITLSPTLFTGFLIPLALYAGAVYNIEYYSAPRKCILLLTGFAAGWVPFGLVLGWVIS